MGHADNLRKSMISMHVSLIDLRSMDALIDARRLTILQKEDYRLWQLVIKANELRESNKPEEYLNALGICTIDGNKLTCGEVQRIFEYNRELYEAHNKIIELQEAFVKMMKQHPDSSEDKKLGELVSTHDMKEKAKEIGTTTRHFELAYARPSGYFGKTMDDIDIGNVYLEPEIDSEDLALWDMRYRIG